MNDAVRLIEINGFGDVGRDFGVALANLRDTVYLDCEKHGYAVFLQFSCKSYRLRATPAMSVENDAGISLLLDRKHSITIDVEALQNLLVRPRPAAILKSLCVDCRTVGSPEILG